MKDTDGTNDKQLTLMVGLPRSGKSTYARKMGCPIVNPDSIRLALHGQRFASEAEPMVWAMAKYMVKALFLAGHRSVVVDATNTTKKRRDAWLSDGWTIRMIHIDTPKATCIERAVAENDTDIVPVIERMADEFEDIDGWKVQQRTARNND